MIPRARLELVAVAIPANEANNEVDGAGLSDRLAT